MQINYPRFHQAKFFKDFLNVNKFAYTELTENFRQKSDSSIVGISNQIIENNFKLPDNFEGEFKFIKEKNELKIKNLVLKLFLEHLPNKRKGINRDQDIQILSPMKKVY